MRKLATILGRIIFIPLEILLFSLIVLFHIIVMKGDIPAPKVKKVDLPERVRIGENYYGVGDNYLRLNEHGIWELYLEGTSYERGLAYGVLTRELNNYQEEVFVESINTFVPPGFFQNILKIFVAFFNSDIPKYIPEEYQRELYGISQTFSDQFDYIGPKYSRILNYHAAHDLGHALNDYSVVGCTSFAVRGDKSTDGQLLIGRNFDFYVGDDFAKNKILMVMKPATGYAFASVSWAGYMGVSSGLNNKGISVTINAAKSDVPRGAKTPIGLLAREILQYSKNIDEAIEIARKRKVFVSETILVSSGKENRAVLIEISPNKFGVKEMTSDYMVCANHYQSDVYSNDSNNIKNIENSDSKYRFDRLTQLVQSEKQITPLKAASFLRDQYGFNKDTLGMGNPRAINQLLAHHSVVIQPSHSLLFVSTKPYQLGKYIGLNVEKSVMQRKLVYDDEIENDQFLYSHQYTQFAYFKAIKQEIQKYLWGKNSLELTEEDIALFIASNSESYMTYEVLGNYFWHKEQFKRAGEFYSQALTKNVVSKEAESALKKRVEESKKK